MKKKLLIVGGVVFAVLLVMFFRVTDGLSDGAGLALHGIDLSNVPDGSYTGAYEFKRWSNTLVVHVRGHRITGIDVSQDVLGASITNCADETFSRVIDAQDTKVDAVTGATVTSKAYLKAIENAFRQ
jgi:uncharacterized protein with FMN-binding domain